MVALPLLLATAAANLPNLTAVGTYQVKTTEETIGGFVSGGPQGAYVSYPDSTQTGAFPLISFAHGDDAGGKALIGFYRTLMEAWASAGYVVVAPEACSGDLCLWQKTAQFAQDQIHVIDVVKGNPTHPIWSLVDTSRIAIAGHSMGGVATVYNAAKYPSGAPFQCAAPLHPCPDIEGAKLGDIHTPIFYGTGSLDTVCSIPAVKQQYTASAQPKVFVELSGATHFEPTLKGTTRWNTHPVRFFNCHLNYGPDVAGDCEYIYGTASGDLCQGGAKTTECHAVGGGVPPPVPPTPPAPTPSPPLPPTPPTPPAPAPASCNAQDGTDCASEVSTDMGVMQGAGACCEACRSSLGCGVWTWVKSGDNAGRCYVKKDCAKSILDDTKVSGVLANSTRTL